MKTKTITGEEFEAASERYNQLSEIEYLSDDEQEQLEHYLYVMELYLKQQGIKTNNNQLL